MTTNRILRALASAAVTLAVALALSPPGLAMFAGTASMSTPQLGDTLIVGAQADVEGWWANDMPVSSVEVKIIWSYFEGSNFHDISTWYGHATLDNAFSGTFDGTFLPLRDYILESTYPSGSYMVVVDTW